MNTYTVKQLRDIAKGRGIKGYYGLRKAELISLLEKPQKLPTKPVRPIAPEDMDIFERQEMIKARPTIGGKIREWHNWLLPPSEMDLFEKQELDYWCINGGKKFLSTSTGKRPKQS